MRKDLPFSMSLSKSSSLPGTSTTSPSLDFTSDAFQTEIRLAMKCITSHYSERSMNELLKLLAMIFPDLRISGNITLGCTKLTLCYQFGLR